MLYHRHKVSILKTLGAERCVSSDPLNGQKMVFTRVELTIELYTGNQWPGLLLVWFPARNGHHLEICSYS